MLFISAEHVEVMSTVLDADTTVCAACEQLEALGRVGPLLANASGVATLPVESPDV